MSTVLFVTNGLATRSGFQTQAITMLKGLAEDGQSIAVLDFEESQNKVAPPLPVPRQVTVTMRTKGPLALLSAAVAVKRLASEIDAQAVHARGHVAGIVACLSRLLGAPQYIMDTRGVAIQEGVAMGKWRAGSLYHAVLLVLEKLIFRRARHVLAVSEPMRQYILTRAPKARVTVVPCCVPEGWFKYREEWRRARREVLGLAGKFVLTYSGGTDTWQQIGPMFDLFATLHQSLPQAHLLLLSNGDQDVIRREVSSRGIGEESYTLISVPHGEVPNYLVAADSALLLRDDSIINRVASPVKFAEYLLSGLPVVLTDGIGDVSTLVGHTGVGTCVHPARPSDALGYLRVLAGMNEEDRETLRERCVSVGNQQFIITKYLDVYRSIYARLSGGGGR